MKRYLLVVILLTILAVVTACANKPAVQNDSSPVNPVQKKSSFEHISSGAMQKVIFEDRGKFVMIEGQECVPRDNGHTTATMLIFVNMPDYVDQGTVVLNGWNLRYLHGDHEIRTLQADITQSKMVTGSTGTPALLFEVEGQLSDQSGANAFEFCVYYTSIGYSSRFIGARVEENHGGINASALQTKAKGAIAMLASTWPDSTLTNNPVAVLPRGFHFQFDNQFECELRLIPCKWSDPVDHNLRQVAYSLFQVGASPNPEGKPHWLTQTIFKDNQQRTYWTKTRAALISGSSVKLHIEPLALNPVSGKTNVCRNGVDGVVRTEAVRIDDLPYDYAIPMLTGWDLNYECSHQQVQRAGIWIHDIHFNPGLRSLEYKVSSILRDENGAPSFNAAHRVTVLGLNQLPPIVQRPAPDLKIKLRQTESTNKRSQ